MEIEKNNPEVLLNEIERNVPQTQRIREELYQECTTKRGINWDKLNHLLSKKIIEMENIFTYEDTDEIYMYMDGIYSAGEKTIAVFIQDVLEQDAKNHRINEIFGHIRRQTYVKRKEIFEEKDKICFLNGVLDTKTLKIIGHSPDYIFFNKIPINYLSSADCPRIKKFISEIVTEEDTSILQEIAGFLLYKNYFIHKAIMFVGSGANGKSTFINLLKIFLGEENCVSVPLHHLEEDKFALASLYSKLANLFADLPSRALRNTSIFKMLVGEDLIPAEKKFKDKFFFVNYAKQLFSCNQVPKSPDDSDAFFRRWVILNFPNQFLNSKADKNLLQRLTTPEELSGFLNFALDGLKRLIANQDFSNTSSVSEVRDNYIRLSDSVGAFILDCIEIAPEGYETKKELYTHYAEYCRCNKYPIVPENTFHRDLQKQIRVEDYRPLIEKIRVTCWKGIKCNYMQNNPDNTDNDGQVKEVNNVKAKSHIKGNLNFDDLNLGEKNG